MRIINTFLSFVISITLSLTAAMAQEMSEPEKQQNLQNLGTSDLSGMVRTYDERYEGVKGHPLFFEDWVTGSVLLENNQEYQAELQYNVHTDELIVKQKGRDPVILDKERVRAFSMGVNDAANMANFVKASYLEHELPRVKEDKYVQVLYDGETVLYAINRKPLNKANYKGAYNTGQTYDEFGELDASYYFVGPHGVKKMKNNEKSVLKALGDKKDGKLADYIEEQNLDLQDRTDLVELIMYYENQLDRGTP